MAFVLLDTKQLRTLAELIYNREVEAVRKIQFSTEHDRAQYLTDCRNNYQAVLALLDSAGQLKQEFQGDNVRGPIADDIFSYLEIAVNASLQTLRNYEMRSSYIAKIKDHADEMMTSLRTLDVTDAAEVEHLAETAASFKKIMLEYHRTWNSPLSQNFSRVLQQSGRTFQEVVSSYQVNLGLEGTFENLSDDKKIQVYDSIVKASGQESSMVDLVKKLEKKGGIASLLYTAGTMVWDIYSSESKVDTTLKNLIEAGASFGGATLGKALGVAVAGQLTKSMLCSVMIGITAGIAGAVVLGAFASWLVETFLSSGGYPVIVTTDLQYYTAETPDGVALARQIAHGSN